MTELLLTDELMRYDYLLGESSSLYHDIALRLGLTDSALDVMYALSLNGGSSPLQLIVKNSGLSKQTVNSAVRKLEKDGIIYLTAEGRTKTVWLSAKGRDLEEQTVKRLLHMEDKVLAAWQPAEVAQMLTLMERFLTDLRAAAEEL